MGVQAMKAERSTVLGPDASDQPVKRAVLSATASGDLVAAVTGARIRVLSLVMSSAAAEAITFQSGATSNLTGAMTLAIGTPLVLPFNPHGWFTTAASAKLNFVKSGAGQLSGCITYQETDPLDV